MKLSVKFFLSNWTPYVVVDE